MAIALVAVALMALPGSATTAGKIVIYGSNKGSTLTLHKKHGKIIVRGRMAHHHPRGCHFRHGHRVAVCNPRHKRVIDLCAAPGGKTAQLASAGAKVSAVDVSKDRIAMLKTNVHRLQLQAWQLAQLVPAGRSHV